MSTTRFLKPPITDILESNILAKSINWAWLTEATTKHFRLSPPLEMKPTWHLSNSKTCEVPTKKGQVSEEEFAEYFQQEQQAANAFLFNYNKRIDRVMMYRDGLDTLLPKAEELRREALANLDLWWLTIAYLLM